MIYLHQLEVHLFSQEISLITLIIFKIIIKFIRLYKATKDQDIDYSQKLKDLLNTFKNCEDNQEKIKLYKDLNKKKEKRIRFDFCDNLTREKCMSVYLQ